ncbi:hypothetical protein LWI28_012471 [Acer negundo]|uniref:Uncharacterized protein n=1 Tax=Acer negundo TaxID=4023 RepID=A0AAD5IA46_ACENE|nr:hypothetical protein LWI28_012471 [Acer negundo]
MDSSVAPIMIENCDHQHITTHPQKPSKKGGWNSAVFIIFVEVAERFAFYGLAGNLITYLTNVLHEPTATAAKNVSTWMGVSAIFPIFGAFIADSYLGRFKTILLASVTYFLVSPPPPPFVFCFFSPGMVLLSLAVSVIPLEYRKAAFFTALYILAVGVGGHKPCVQTFAADQFDENNPQEREAKSSFFNWWYLGIVAAASTAILVVIYIQDNVGWAAGFGVLAGALAVSLTMFLVGIKRYKKESPVGSPFSTVVQVLVAAVRKWRVSETRCGHGIYYGDEKSESFKVQKFGRTNQLRFIDKAMIIDDIDYSSKMKNPWRLCSLNQVEEVKLVVRLMPIWLGCLMFSAILVQLHTFYTKQGSTMIRSIGPNFQIPPASLQSLVGLMILVTVPIYDRIFVPLARKFTGCPSGITMLQRIGTGLFLSIINMGVAGLIEGKRVKTASEHGLMDSPKAIVPMSVWWLIPQYLISAISDVFTVVGLQELFYDQMPEAMRSMGAAAYISIIGVGTFLNSALISIVQAITVKNGDIWLGNNLNRAHLDRFYYLLAGLSAVNFCVYLWIANGFVYKKVLEDHEIIKEENFDGNWNREMKMVNDV